MRGEFPPSPWECTLAAAQITQHHSPVAKVNWKQNRLNGDKGRNLGVNPNIIHSVTSFPNTLEPMWQDPQITQSLLTEINVNSS